MRIVGTLLSKHWRPVFEILLGVKIALLIVGAALAIWLGPFHDGDSPPAVLTGMVFVSAMAIQNAIHRVYLGSAPPSTLMTGTTTQIMIDLADIIVRGGDGHPAGVRSGKMALNVLLFAIGCRPSLHAFQDVVLRTAADCKRSRACNSLCRPGG